MKTVKQRISQKKDFPKNIVYYDAAFLGKPIWGKPSFLAALLQIIYRVQHDNRIFETPCQLVFRDFASSKWILLIVLRLGQRFTSLNVPLFVN